MTTNINFPNLGIHLKNVGQTISVFGFEIAYYGIIIGLGVLAGIAIAAFLAKKTGQDPDTYYDLALYAVVLSVLGARIYYVIFSWDSYKDDLLSIFNIRQGGLAIYGGVITAIITVYVYAKVKKIPFGLMTDTAGPGLILGQIIGRWGNFFNREAFGGYCDNMFAMQLPVSAVRSSDITQELREHIMVIDGISYIQVHPTFLYESLWCLLGVLVLHLISKKRKFSGQIVLCYGIWYGFERTFIELLRTDSLMLGNIRVSSLLSLILCITCASLLFVFSRKYKNNSETVEYAEMIEISDELDEAVKETEENGEIN